MKLGRYHGLVSGGYPQANTVGVTTDGLIAYSTGEDIVAKAKEVEVASGNLVEGDRLSFKEFAIQVDAPCWIYINGNTVGTSISPDDGFYVPVAQEAFKLELSAEVNYKVGYMR